MKLEPVSLQDMKVNLDSTRKKKVGVEWNRASLVAQMVKKKKKICLQCRRHGFNPWVSKIPWRREWQPTPIFLPGEFHGQRSLRLQSTGSQRVVHDQATNPRKD